MATRNREAIQATMEVMIDSLRSQLDNVEPTVLEAMDLFDVIGERRTSALDMMSVRSYRMMREWVGERDESLDRRVFKSRVQARKFQDSVSIPIEDIEDGNLANYDPGDQTSGLLMAYRNRVAYEQHDYLVHSMDEQYHGGEMTGSNGEVIFSGSMDGEPLLSDSHPYFERVEFDSTAAPGQRVRIITSGTWSNLANDDLTRENLYKARREFRKMTNHHSIPANMGTPNVLVVGPDLEEKAEEILEQNLRVVQTSDGVTAVDNNDSQRLNLEVMTNNWLDGPETIGEITFGGTTYTAQELDSGKFWFLVNTRPDVKPFVRWDRKLPEIQVPIGTPDFASANPAEGAVAYPVYREDAAKVGIRTRFGHSFGVPHVIYGSLGGQTLTE